MYEDDQFEWDKGKAALNLVTHGVSFEEARDAFDDPHAIEIFDDEHSEDELRYQLIGLSGRRLLFVVFTGRGNRKRLIHARKATKPMEQLYVETNA
jgi:hypothetical protein